MAWSRRDVLRNGAVAGALLAMSRVRTALASAPEVASLPTGTVLGPCKLAAVLPVERGVLPVVLEDPRGKTFVVEVHRHDPRAPGIARAGSLDVFVRNGGNGATTTDESHGLGAMALAELLAERERAGRRIPRLASIVERWRHDPPRRR
jgi:hypothetical protein